MEKRTLELPKDMAPSWLPLPTLDVGSRFGDLMLKKSNKALVADDDEFFRTTFCSILKRELGFSKITEAASLDEALDNLGHENSISVAFFDLHMPGVMSPANLRAVRECYPDLRVVVVSASSRRQDILLALDVGVHGYITKSQGIKNLVAAVRTIQNGEIFVPSSIAEISAASESNATGSYRQLAPQDNVTKVVLTKRQRDVLRLLVQGNSNKEIARSLNLGEGTVKVHMSALFRNMGVQTRTAAAAAGVDLLKQ